MTIDELLAKAEERIEGQGGYVPNPISALAYIALAFVRILYEIEEEGRGDPEL